MSSCGTRMHTVSVAFPMSSAATRSTSAPGSSVISSMTMILPASSFQAGCPREPEGGSEAESRARGNNAGPLWQAPSARLLCGLNGTKHHRLRRAPHPIFTLQGVAARHGRLLCLSRGLDDVSMAAVLGSQGWCSNRVIAGLRTRQGWAARDGACKLLLGHAQQVRDE